jgi:hypothetical protein
VCMCVYVCLYCVVDLFIWDEVTVHVCMCVRVCMYVRIEVWIYLYGMRSLHVCMCVCMYTHQPDSILVLISYVQNISPIGLNL